MNNMHSRIVTLSLVIASRVVRGTSLLDELNANKTAPSGYQHQTENIFQIVDDNYISASPCCGQLNLTAESHHGVWMIHFNKLGSYTVTNTLVRGRPTWIHDTDPELLISWCGEFWHIGHRDQAGQCAGYVSSPDNMHCFDTAANFRHYVHCINEWVSAEPSNLRIQCLDDLDITSIPGIIPKGQGQQFTETDREQKLANQQNLDIDPRLLP